MKTIKRQRKKKTKSKNKLQRKRTHRRRKILRGGSDTSYTYDELDDAHLWSELTASREDDRDMMVELFLLYRNDEDRAILEKAYNMVKQYKVKGYRYNGRIIFYSQNEKHGPSLTDFDEENGFTVGRSEYKTPQFYEENAEKLTDKELVEITFKDLIIRKRDEKQRKKDAAKGLKTFSQSDHESLLEKQRRMAKLTSEMKQMANVEHQHPVDYQTPTSEGGLFGSLGSRLRSLRRGGGTHEDLRKKIKKIKKSKRRGKRKTKKR